MSSTLFYAWQSDRSNRTNRTLIRSALNDAIKILSEDVTIVDCPVIDQDTTNTPGTPGVADTILAKIAMCRVFVADLTIVSDSSAARPTPNPNVLIELGYAASQCGWDRIICIMNTAFGNPEHLPFDLVHRRWPIQYDVAENSDEIKSVRSTLSKELANAIRIILQNTTATSADTSAAQLIENEAENFLSYIGHHHYNSVKTHEGALGIYVASMCVKEWIPDWVNLEPTLKQRLVPPGYGGIFFERHPNGFITFSTDRDTKDRIAVAEITQNGEIKAVTSDVFVMSGDDDEINHVLPSVSLEKDIFESVSIYLRLLHEIRLRGPWLVAVRLVELPQCKMGVGQSVVDRHVRTFEGGLIAPNAIILDDEEDLSFEAIAQTLRPIANYIWRTFGFAASLHYDDDGVWHRR